MQKWRKMGENVENTIKMEEKMNGKLGKTHGKLMKPLGKLLKNCRKTQEKV